jgi:hypothetical protein
VHLVEHGDFESKSVPKGVAYIVPRAKSATDLHGRVCTHVHQQALWVHEHVAYVYGRDAFPANHMSFLASIDRCFRMEFLLSDGTGMRRRSTCIEVAHLLWAWNGRQTSPLTRSAARAYTKCSPEESLSLSRRGERGRRPCSYNWHQCFDHLPEKCGR